MPDLKAQTITLHEGDKTALQYLGAAVVLQWSSMPEDVRKALLRQADAVGGLPLVSDLHEQIQALIHRVRDQILSVYLADNVKARRMLSTGIYVPKVAADGKKRVNSQESLLAKRKNSHRAKSGKSKLVRDDD